MANDDRTAGVGDAPADDVAVTGGNTNGFVTGNGNGGPRREARSAAAGGPFGSLAASPAPAPTATRSATATRPAPAVPLVPPVRSNPKPAAPVARTGAASAATATVVTGRQAAPAAEPATGAAPSPPAPARLRPPVRTRMARRPRVRKVNRVVRRVDAWSVFKIAVVFWAVVFAILLVAGMLLWNLAESTGTITNVEGFVKDLFGLKTFEFDAGSVLRAAWVLGVVLVVGGTACTVTLAVLFNLISDLLGGVRVTVLEEEVVLRPPPQAAPPSAEVPVTRAR